eukprot:6841-Heterococcus_DN1.PRE.3
MHCSACPQLSSTVVLTHNGGVDIQQCGRHKELPSSYKLFVNTFVGISRALNGLVASGYSGHVPLRYRRTLTIAAHMRTLLWYTSCAITQSMYLHIYVYIVRTTALLPVLLLLQAP